jgi:hypothetical protein
MSTRTIVIAVFFCLSSLFAKADPSNVLVGDLYFERPEQWSWLAPSDASAASARFVIAKETSQRAGTEVRFYVTDRKPKESIEGWNKFFPDPTHRATAQEERKIVAGRKVVWFTMRGTYVFPKNPVRPDYLFVAVMISHGDKFIMVRLSGLEADAGKALPRFEKMIEDALASAPPV